MKKQTKIMMAVLSALFMFAWILSFSFLSVNAEGNVTEIFPDVKEGAWYVKYVQYVYDNGIMAGNKDGTFATDKPLLREQFSQVLYSMAGKPGVAANAANPFTDVKNNPGYPRDAILWAYENGIASGNADRTFGVGSRIQRQAVASMLYKYASANGYDLSSNDNALSGFSDSSKVETWAVTSMKWAVSQGIIAGKSGRLDPAGTATRAECAAMIMKLQAIEMADVTPLMDWHSILNFTEPVPWENNPEERMAHNIYSDPDLSGTSGKYSGFLIDFCTDHAGTSTYWALCNWNMDISDFMSKYTVLDSENAAGAYAGLQNRPDGKKAIMSFWEVQYLDKYNNVKSLRAKRVYPAGGDTNQFGGEGEGSNYITDYYWKTGKWYRMYICCYDDSSTGHTFVEQWVMDIEKGVWTKISCFDTGLCHSYFKGAMSQFMENYSWEYSNEVRTFAYRNMYVREYDTGQWKYINQSELVVDTWWDNKKGKFAFTADGNTLYGITCGYGPDTAALNDDIRRKYAISSTSGPVTP